MQNCPKCGAKMVPMIMSSFCPNDCDRPAITTQVDRSDRPWMKYDTGHSIAVKGMPGGSYYVYHYSRADVLCDAPMPVSSEYLRGWWCDSDFEDIEKTISGLTKEANRGYRPGWGFTDTEKYVKKNFPEEGVATGVLIFAWVEE